MNKKETTIGDLAVKLDRIESGLVKRIGDAETNLAERIDSSTESLAAMTKREFDVVHSEIVKSREESGKHFELVENAQVDIKLRQDNTTYRFEFNALEKRVERLEKARRS